MVLEQMALGAAYCDIANSAIYARSSKLVGDIVRISFELSWVINLGP